MNATLHRRNPWPIVIIVYFILFASCIAGFVTWAVRQNMDLVRKDYYEEEVRFQQQMEKVTRTKPLDAGIAVAYAAKEGLLKLRLPQAHAASQPVGRIDLYRPSDASLDRHLTLGVEPDGTQSITTKALRAGLWKVRLSWNVNGQEYFCERSILVD